MGRHAAIAPIVESRVSPLGSSSVTSTPIAERARGSDTLSAAAAIGTAVTTLLPESARSRSYSAC